MILAQKTPVPGDAVKLYTIGADGPLEVTVAVCNQTKEAAFIGIAVTRGGVELSAANYIVVKSLAPGDTLLVWELDLIPTESVWVRTSVAPVSFNLIKDRGPE